MVAHNTVRTYGVNQVFRFVKGIRLLRQSRQFQKKTRETTYFTSLRAQHVLSLHLL